MLYEHCFLDSNSTPGLSLYIALPVVVIAFLLVFKELVLKNVCCRDLLKPSKSKFYRGQ